MTIHQDICSPQLEMAYIAAQCCTTANNLTKQSCDKPSWYFYALTVSKLSQRVSMQGPQGYITILLRGS